MKSEGNNLLQHSPVRYGFALAAVGGGFLMRLGLEAWVGESLPLFITFYPAVMAVALVAGLGPGLFATLVTMLVADYWILPPIGQFGVGRPQDMLALGLFGCMGAAISVVMERYRGSRRQVATYEQELALREASTQRGLALEASGLGAWDYRFDTGEVFWDERCRNMWGLAGATQTDYATAMQRVHPEDFAATDAAVQRAIAGHDGGAFHQEFRVVHPDGSVRWISSHGRTLFEGEGEQRHPIRFIGITADATRQKAVETELRQSRIDLEARLDQQTMQIRRANESLEQRIAARTAELAAANDSLCESRAAAVRLMEEAVAARQRAEQASEALRREVAERQQAQAALLRAKQEWERTFDTVPDLIAVLDDQHRIIRANQAMARRLGLTPGQCINRFCYECVHGQPPPGQCPHKLTLADGQEHSAEVHEDRLGGDFHVTTTPLHDEQGRTVGAVHVARDITARKRAETVLRENEERLRLAQRAGHVGVFDEDFPAKACHWTDEWKVIFGVPPDFAGTPAAWESLIHPEDRAAVAAERERTFQARGSELEIAYRIIRPDGQTRWVEDRGSITYDAAGRPLRLLGTTVDVTVHKQVLEKFGQHRKRFRHSATRLMIALVLSIFTAELAIMITLALLPPMPHWVGSVLDAVTMVVLIGPVLYYFTFRPLVRLLQERQQAEDALRQANAELDRRVQERTASLNRASAELQQSQRDLNHAQAVAHTGSWRLNVRRNELLWSDENHRIFGVPKGTAMTYEMFLNAVLPEDREFVDRSWAAALRGEPYDIEHRILVNGTIKWVHELAELEFDEAGGLLGGFGTTQDITTLKQAESARRESEERLRQALRVGRVFAFEWEPRDDRVVRSPHCAEILGLMDESATRDTGQNFFERVHSRDRARFEAALNQLSPEADTYHLKYRFNRPDGSAVTLEETARGFFNAGRRLERLVGITADITAREQIQQNIEWELAVNQSLAALSQAVLTPDATIEKVADCVLTQALQLARTRDGVVCFANPTTGEAVCHASMATVRNGQPVVERRCYTCPPGAEDALPARAGMPAETEPPKLPAAQIAPEQLLIMPVRLGQERVGHILAANPEEPFSRREAAAISRLAEHYALAIQLMRFKQQLESERDFVQAILSTAGALVVVLDTQGRIVRFNRTCEETTGYAFAEVAGQPFWDLFLVPEEAEGVRQTFDYLLAGNFPNRHENHWRGKDGSLRRITWSNSVLRDAQAKVQYVIGAGLDVTQIRAAEDKLRVLSRAIEAGPACVIITDPSGTIQYVNPAVAHLTGYATAEVIGQNPRLWKSNHHPAQFYAALWQTLNQGHEWHGEFCNKKKNGDRFWVYATISPIRSESGAITHFVAVTVDITERTQMEEALLRAREHLERKVAERTAELNATILNLHLEIEARRNAESEIQSLLQFERVVTDISTGFASPLPGKFEQVALDGIQRLTEYFGADRAALAEFAGADIRLTVRWQADGVTPAQGRLAAEEFPWCLACLRRQERVVFASLDELANQAPVDRQSFLKHGTKSLLALPLVVGQEVLGALLFANILRERPWSLESVQRLRLVEDIFAALLMRWRSEQALSEAKNQYHALANFMQDWDYWESTEGTLFFCSPACERITGYSPQRFLVQPSLIHELVVAEDASLWEEHRCGRLASGAPRNLEFRIRRADGEIRWIEHNCQAVTGPDGGFMGIRVSNRDNTEVKLRELETQRLREDLVHMSRVTMANQLAAALAHELRQPLAAIMSNAEAAAQFLALPAPVLAEAQDALQDIIHNDERASEVIKRMRALYRKTGDEHAPLSLNRLIEETLGLLRSELILRHISWQMELASGLPEVSGNRVEMQQVIMNLILNAVDAMAQTAPPARRLLIRTGRDDAGGVRVEVCDAGTGIDLAVAGRLFEPFVTTKASGIGMGLSISRAIVEAHGGRMGAANNPDCGATFHFTLPPKPEFKEP